MNMAVPHREPISVVLARFEDITGRGLRALIEDDTNLSLVAIDVPADLIASEIERRAPRVAILNFGALANTSEIRVFYDHLGIIHCQYCSRARQSTFWRSWCLDDILSRLDMSSIPFCPYFLPVSPGATGLSAPQRRWWWLPSLGRDARSRG